MTNRVIVTGIKKKFARLEPSLKRASSRILRFLGAENAVVEIFLVGGRTMQKNVLAFPAPKGFARPDVRTKKPLGEIYLNPDYIAKEKREVGGRELKTPDEKLLYMLIHGILHLRGYYHEKKSDRIRMERKEAALLAQLKQ